MCRSWIGTSLVVAVVVGAAALVATAGAHAPSAIAGSGVRAVAPARVAGDGSALPCDPAIHRSFDRRVLPLGDEIGVRVTYDYRCSEDKRRVRMVVVLDATADGGQRPRLLMNLLDGFGDLVRVIDFDNGSLVGVVMAAQGGGLQVTPLQRLQTWPTPDTVSVPGSGLGDAVAYATDHFPPQDPTFTDILFVIDAGAPLDTDPSAPGFAWCRTPPRPGLTRVVVGLAGHDRLDECATVSWFFVSASPDGDDLPGADGLFARIGGRVVLPQQVGYVEYVDQLQQRFEYVPGSAQVDGQAYEPSQALPGELTWMFDDPPPVGAREIVYRVQARPDFGEGPARVSNRAFLHLEYAGTAPGDLDAENPLVCRYVRTRPEVCAGFEVDPTATPSQAPSPAVTTPPPVTTVPSATTTPSTHPPHQVFFPHASSKRPAGGF